MIFVIKRLNDDEMEQTANGTAGPEDSWTSVKVPFMNENLAVCATAADGEEKVSGYSVDCDNVY